MKNSYNMENRWDYYHVWVRLWEDMKSGQWINLKVFKNQIKDKSLEDEYLLNDI